MSSKRQDLAALLSPYPVLFNGKLGQYPHQLVHVERKSDAKPSHCRLVPRHHQVVFKEELDHICVIGMLSHCVASGWLLPSFIIPKKDGFPTFGD
jgi:hypothetical protein